DGHENSASFVVKAFEKRMILDTKNNQGIIDDGKETYHIEPNHDYQLRRSIVVNMEEVYRPFLTTDETRYNEVLFVVDNGLPKAYICCYNYISGYNKNSKTVINKVAILCNAVDAIYQRINVRIVMAAIEIWTNGDRMVRQAGGGQELRTFGKYRKAELIGKIPHDNAQFLSHHGWGRVAGMAWVGTMCGSLSAAVNMWSSRRIIGPFFIVAHEMGHNFGYGHNKAPCKCLTKGCFMGGGRSSGVPGFSDCNLNRMKRINDRCLYNVPTKALNARCGNGIREGDEECDCGTPEMCKAKDPCCLPHDCRLKPSAMCSDLHHSCCKSCQLKKQGTLCRAVQTDCDAPEYCTGESRDCPGDSVIQDGTPCNRTNKLLLGNTNRNSVVMRTLSPRIEARYVRINPQYWNGRICMRTELYGCSSNEDCVIPLGIRSKRIPDSSMTASSSLSGNLPHYARLHNSKYWCAAEKKKSEYLQIDLGKMQTINKIAIQGRGRWNNWVSGFFLLYSQDGQRWTGYTESGDRLHSNVRSNVVPM
ncbi:hypothetical protein QZH41_016842, partial [Actinostola sp. cb2023]